MPVLSVRLDQNLKVELAVSIFKVIDFPIIIVIDDHDNKSNFYINSKHKPKAKAGSLIYQRQTEKYIFAVHSVKGKAALVAQGQAYS